MNLSDAVIGLKAYKEVDKRMTDLWLGLDRLIIGPRMNLRGKVLPAIKVGEVRSGCQPNLSDIPANLIAIKEFCPGNRPGRQNGQVSVLRSHANT